MPCGVSCAVVIGRWKDLLGAFFFCARWLIEILTRLCNPGKWWRSFDERLD